MATRKRCPVCGSNKVEFFYPAEYEYKECGLSGVILMGRGVRRSNCSDCGQKTTRIIMEQQLLQLIGLALLINAGDMRGEDLRYLRRMFGMTQKELATQIGTGRRETVAEWEARERAFDTKFDEMGRRLVLLHLFRSEVLDSDHNFLDDAHRDLVEKYMDNLLDDIVKLTKPAPTVKKTVTLKHRPRLQEWDLATAV